MAQDTLLGFPAHILPYRFLDSLRQGKHLPFWPVLTSFWKGALLVEKRIDRVIFTCGGTAGHVNPAIAVAQLMAEKNPQIKILFVGAERGLEKDLIPKAGYEFRTVHISSFHRSLKPAEIKHNLVSLYNMVRSPAEARAILKEFRPDAVIGTGGHHTDQVYRFTAERWERKIWSIKGKGGADVPYIRNPTTNNRVKTPLFIIGVDAGKALLYQRLRHETKGPNYCHFPLNEEAGYDEQYFIGLTAEKMVVRWRKGRSVVAWELKDSKHKRNEPLDLRNYATAALEIANPILQEGEIAKPIRKRPAGRRRRGGI